MSITIRLSKIGKKNSPTYRMIATTTRSKRNGRELDILGFYNPQNTKELFEYDKKKFEYWKKEGAQVSIAVQKLIDGKYQFTKYEPKKDKQKAE